MPLPNLSNLNVPILGQPKIGDFTFAFVLTCPCGHTFLWTGKVKEIKACPGTECKKLYMLSDWPIMLPDGKLNVNLAVGFSQPASV
jgi:hypothetical protein